MSSLTITTIQTDVRWEDKAANLHHFGERIMAIPEPAEVVILPEMFSTGFSMKPEGLAESMDGPTLNWMREIAARKRVILTGSFIAEEEGRYYNRLIWMLPNGQYGSYDKRHRFAYAGEDEHYTAGRKRLVASVKGWRVLLLVCYDLRFPVWIRQSPPVREAGVDEAGRVTGVVEGAGSVDAEPEYDLLICVANWPERRAHAWKTLLCARAIENQCYVAGVNRIGEDGHGIAHRGDTMIIGPLGETLYHADAKEDVFTVTLQKDDLHQVRKRFPFWRDADRFSIET